MPRVMMVIEPTTGGTARHVTALAVGCRARGIDVHLVCRRDNAFRNAVREVRDAGVHVDEVEMRREIHPLLDSMAAFRIRRLITDASPDVLHLHSSKAGALGRGAVVGLGRRAPAVVYTPHAYAFMAQAGPLHRLCYWCVERVLLPWTNRVVAVSPSEGRAATRLGAEERVAIIPNGVDTSDDSSPEIAPHPWLRIGWLGRLVWQKNPEAAVKASFVLSRLGVPHELLVGGEGPHRDRLRRAIAECRSEHWVRELGFVEDTEAFHSNIDILLITSRSDGLPYAGLDAMAHAVPIVGFDVPGVQDLVEHGVNGLLAPAGDAGALAAHLARLARDPELRRRFGLAARERVRREFRFETQLDRVCRLYESLASIRSQRAA
jgi:glycosyltransferase involved in cell wall biosynthesis